MTKLQDHLDRLKVLAYNLLEASERDDQAAIKQSAGELRAWFDTEKQHPY